MHGRDEAEEDEEAEESHGIVIEDEVVAGETVRILLYDEGSRLEGETVYINDEEKGETNNAGALRLEIPNKEEVTIDTDYPGIDSKEVEVEGVTETVTEIEASFQEDLRQRQENTIQLNTDGEAAADINIYVNGENKGETNSDGELGLEVPEDEFLTVYASADGLEYEEEFETQRPEFDYTVIEPVDTDVNDYKPDFVFDSYLDSGAEIGLNLNGETVETFDVDGGENTIQDSFYVEEGQNEWYLEADINGQSYASETYSFENSESLPEVDINIENPSDEETIDGYGTDVAFETNTTLDYTFKAKADGKIFESFDVPGVYLNHETYLNGLEPGNHDIEIAVIDDSGRETISEPVTVETTEEPLIADVDLVFPDDGGPATSDERGALQYQIEAFNDVNARLYADDDLVSEKEFELEDGWLTTGEETVTEEDIPEGEYEWYVEVEDLETGEVIESESRTTNQ